MENSKTENGQQNINPEFEALIPPGLQEQLDASRYVEFRKISLPYRA